MNANVQNLTTTLYFGLSVEVVHKMENYSWVRFSGHDAIVDTDDLSPVQRIQLGLTRTLSSERLGLEPIAFCTPAWDNTVILGFQSIARQAAC